MSVSPTPISAQAARLAAELPPSLLETLAEVLAASHAMPSSPAFSSSRYFVFKMI
jgi:hypothetical protein